MRSSYERLSLFIKLNFGITLLLFFSFLVFNDYNIKNFLFTVLAALSSAAILYFLFYILIAPFFFLKRKMLVFSALIFATTNLALVVDFFIFRIWHFHINGMVLNIMFSPAAYDSVATGALVKVAVVFVVLTLIYLQYFLLKHVLAADLVQVKKHNRLFLLRVFPVLFLLVFSEKVISGFALMYANVPLLERTKAIPLYMPVNFTLEMERHFGLVAEKSDKQDLYISKESKVNYPLEALSFGKKNPVNIFVFALDSTRYEIVNEDVMPNLTKFSKDNSVYHNHFSGGNTTRFGIFSLWYGLNANYWFSFLNAQKGPVFFDMLNELDYQSHIFSSSSTVWPEFKKTTYYNIQEKISDEYNKGYVQNDIDASSDFISWLDEVDKDKPIFSFVFLDAPHGPYSFPKEFAKFQPVGDDGVEYLSVSKDDAKLLLNKYKNANYFSDSLIGKMISALKKKGLYNDSIIIITSDHGEEFYEFGTFGHNNAFNKMQTQVPFIVHWPKVGHQNIYKMTSHLDLAPTVLNYIGVTTEAKKYSMGKNVLDEDFQRDYVFIGNWNNNTILTDDYTYVFNNVNFFDSKVYSTETYKVSDEYNEAHKQKILLNVLDENSRFVK